MPKELASFVDPNLDPQYYIDRYNKEITYKKWFDKTYPEITIFEAVGLEEPVIKEPEFGECGEETKLIDGKCTITSTISEGEGYGIDVILKNIGIYSVAPVMLFFIIRKVRRARF